MAVISEKIIKLLNYRIQQEEQSSRIYLAMSQWLTYNGYIGAGKTWAKYSDEENVHATFARNYLQDLDILPVTPSLPLPEQEFSTFPSIIEKSYKHELDITNQCQELAKACMAEGDFMTLTLAQKYLVEQVEEIAKVTQLLDRISAFSDDKIALRLLDDELNK